MENTTGFTSPLASVNYGAINVPPQVELVVDALSRVSFWTVFWTLLALAVVYDQRMLPQPEIRDMCPMLITLPACSQLHQEQGFHRRPCLEDTIHGPLSRVYEPQVQRV